MAAVPDRRRRRPCRHGAAAAPAMAWCVLGACALVVAFAAATQDIAIDAWRIEIAQDAGRAGPSDLRLHPRLSHRAALHRLADPGVGAASGLARCPTPSAAWLMGIGLIASLLAPRAGARRRGDGAQGTGKAALDAARLFRCRGRALHRLLQDPWRDGAGDAAGDQPVPAARLRARADDRTRSTTTSA